MDTKTKLQIAEKATVTVKFLDGFRPKSILTKSQIEQSVCFARIAEAAYPLVNTDKTITDPVDRLKAIVGEAPIKGYFSDSGAAGYVIRMPDMTIVVFRGTELDLTNLGKIDLRDAKTDLDFKPVRFGVGFAHGGGFKSAMSLSALIDDVSDEPLPIHIVGHSLGSILAYISAVMIPTNTRSHVSGVWAYCPPKTYDDIMTQKYNEVLGNVTLSFVNEIDFVPRFSVPNMKPKLHVPGTVVFLPSGSNIPVSFTLFQRILSAYRGYRLHGLSFKGTTKRLAQCHSIGEVASRLGKMICIGVLPSISP